MEKAEHNSGNQGKLFREMNLSVRDVNEESRTVTMSFSSEAPYERYWGTEILDHSEGCIDLSRLSEIGCLLYNHNRDKVIGGVEKVWIENRRGYAVVRFDEDAESDIIYQKVKKGSLKGVSVGYLVKVWETVKANQKSQDGRFQGPCEIAKSWMPYEVSIVSVPADSTVGVGRSEEDSDSGRMLNHYEKQLQINRNRVSKKGMVGRG